MPIFKCVQQREFGYEYPYYTGDEDCLFLNIMRPDIKYGDHVRIFLILEQ